MKKRAVLILLLLLSLALFAGANGDIQSFEISAYKKAKSDTPSYNLSIYDALSNDLKAVGTNEDIDISNYVSKYLGTYDKNASYSSIELGKRAAFSVHVDGNAPGSYTLSITYQPLAKSEKNSKTNEVTFDYSQIITATYLFSQYSVFFSASEAKKSKDEKQTISISTGSPSNPAVTVDSSNGATTTMQWTVSTVSGDTSATVGSDWQAHGMVALFIDQTSYDEAKYTTYRAKITVLLENK